MSVLSINAQSLVRMFYVGSQSLENNKTWINDLNVFPVPDGDTGTNMSMTLSSAVRELQQLSKNATLPEVTKAISFGSLRGARGNSGVILSQLLRGFCKVAGGYETLDAYALGDACTKAVETAYKAVMKPKEGTILTVAKGICEKWNELTDHEDKLDVLMERVLSYGDEVLAHTPELLPVLKEAGVVDSGGQGLMVFLKGAFDCMMGRDARVPEMVQMAKPAAPEEKKTGRAEISTDNIVFGYCTEFMINLDRELTEEEEDGFRAFLEGMGDSLVLIADEEMCRVHVHTNEPGTALQKALTYGPLAMVKVENMRLQHTTQLERDAERIAEAQKEAEEQRAKRRNKAEWKSYGFIATAVGQGICEVLKELGVDHIVEGGQTMNPSTEDMLEAIAKVHAHTIFIFPNNKNIILAAEQAKALTEDCQVLVIPTTAIPEGITAIMNFDEELTPEENFERMKDSLETVRTGEVTYAVRTTSINGKTIHENDIMALGGDDGLYAVGHDVHDVTLEMVAAMMTEDAGLITLYYGDGVSESDAEALRAALEEKYPECDVEVLYGGQPIYYYIGSVE